MRARLHLAAYFVICLVLGCQSAEKASLRPLPTDGPQLTYLELVQRAKLQIASAQESFYSDRWKEVAEASVMITDTGARLGTLRESDVPEKQRPMWMKSSKDLTDGGLALREASKMEDAIKATQAFQRIYLAIRDLRAD
jgi:hypothetical protein